MMHFLLLTLFATFLGIISSSKYRNIEDFIDTEGDEMVLQDPESTSSRMWPNKKVKYKLDETFSKRDIRAIRTAMDEIESRTCVRWIHRVDICSDMLSISNDGGCWSKLGKVKSVQSISLQSPQCIQRGIILHELLHTLGIPDEHRRMDRDEYVTVDWTNIDGRNNENFQKLDRSWFQNLDELDYDYRSVMHYSAYTKAINKSKTTIKPKREGCFKVKDLGHAAQYGYLTDLDVQKINTLYDCPSP